VTICSPPPASDCLVTKPWSETSRATVLFQENETLHPTRPIMLFIPIQWSSLVIGGFSAMPGHFHSQGHHFHSQGHHFHSAPKCKREVVNVRYNVYRQLWSMIKGSSMICKTCPDHMTRIKLLQHPNYLSLLLLITQLWAVTHNHLPLSKKGEDSAEESILILSQAQHLPGMPRQLHSTIRPSIHGPCDLAIERKTKLFLSVPQILLTSSTSLTWK